jgi:hypothetical protein
MHHEAARQVAFVPRLIQGLILFSALLGVAFLWQAYPLLPSYVFDILAFGWFLFVVDSILTFVRPFASYLLGLVLAVLALSQTLSQPEHYALVESGDVPATLTLVMGSAAQALLIVSIGYYLLARRRKDPWAWPSAEVLPEQEDEQPVQS